MKWILNWLIYMFVPCIFIYLASLAFGFSYYAFVQNSAFATCYSLYVIGGTLVLIVIKDIPKIIP